MGELARYKKLEKSGNNVFLNVNRYDTTIHSLTAPEIVHIARVSGLTVKETLMRLKKAGLDSLPGGGAEVLHDEVRNRISPNKIKTEEWLEVMRTAHQIGMPSTATMMTGSIDNLQHRVVHLIESGNFKMRPVASINLGQAST